MNRVLFVAVFAILTGCSRHAKPSALSFRIGDALGVVYHVETCGDAVCYFAYRNNPKGEKGVQPIRVQPTDRQWAEFRRNIDKAEVWQWKATYDAPMFDGWGWELEIRYPDRQIKSSGANNSPEKFDSALSAVEDLVGRRLSVDR